MTDIINQEPLFSCCQCREEYSYPAIDLRVYKGATWCENCWEYEPPDFDVDYGDLPIYIPEYQKRIAELESLLNKWNHVSQLQTFADRERFRAEVQEALKK